MLRSKHWFSACPRPSAYKSLLPATASTEQSDRGQTSVVIGRQRAIGSGVIVDPEGYIVTNAHVLNGAEKIEVFVPAQPRNHREGRRE